MRVRADVPHVYGAARGETSIVEVSMWLIGIVMAVAGLPVEAIQWEVTVRGPVAEAWVSQRIVNSTAHGLEGVYRLALPAEGAVDALETYVVGRRAAADRAAS